MKTVFERWAELKPYDNMPVTPEEMDLLCFAQMTKVIVGRNGVTFLCGDRIVSHREYQR